MNEDQKNSLKSKLKKTPITSNKDLLLQLFFLIIATKKFWLLPLLLVLAFLGMFVSLTGNTSILPAIYALF